MKKPFRYLGILMILTLTIFSGCEKEPQFDPEEVLVTIDATGWANGGYDLYLIVENQLSAAKYYTIVPGEKLTVKRGSSIKGEKVTAHFVSLMTGITDIWKITSYYDLPLGLEIPLTTAVTNAQEAKSGSNAGIANITFSDVPAFDIVTRSAKIPTHSHTLNTLEVPCAATGGNTFPHNSKFYVSLIKDGLAGYKLITIPEVSDFVISLADINTSMTKYSIPKDPGTQPSITVSGGGNQIFNLQTDLFGGNDIDVFVPSGLSEMSNFTTTFRKNEGEFDYVSIYGNQTNVPSSYNFLDNAFSFTKSPGLMPEVTVNETLGDMLYLNIYDETINQWMVFAPDGKSLYVPEFPADIIDKFADGFSLAGLLTDYRVIYVNLSDDDRIDNYSESLKYRFSIADLPLTPYKLRTTTSKIWGN